MKVVIKHDCTLSNGDDIVDAPNRMGILLFFNGDQSLMSFEIRAFNFTINKFNDKISVVSVKELVEMILC